MQNFENSQPSASNFKSFSRSLEHFFLTVGQNNLVTIYFLWLILTLGDLRRHFQAAIVKKIALLLRKKILGNTRKIKKIVICFQHFHLEFKSSCLEWWMTDSRPNKAATVLRYTMDEMCKFCPNIMTHFSKIGKNLIQYSWKIIKTLEIQIVLSYFLEQFPPRNSFLQPYRSHHFWTELKTSGLGG